MAIYVYRCPDNHVWELDYPMGSAPSEIECTDNFSFYCGNLASRVYLPTAVSFKGSGFYSTDNHKTKHVNTSLKVGGNG